MSGSVGWGSATGDLPTVPEPPVSHRPGPADRVARRARGRRRRRAFVYWTAFTVALTVLVGVAGWLGWVAFQQRRGEMDTSEALGLAAATNVVLVVLLFVDRRPRGDR